MTKFKTPALKRLQEWAKDNEFGPSRLATQLGCEQSQASRWLRGDSRPEPTFRILLAQLTNGAVPEIDWLTADELKELLAGQARLGAS